jgi:DNA-directed RNA polymerase specialized sigma24 family protein
LAHPWPPGRGDNLTIKEEPFDYLLSWLDESNREAAGQKYEVIRRGLIRIFVSKGFNDAEDLADQTMNRVMNRLPEIRPGYIGEPSRYFYAVARKVVLEANRRKEVATDVLPIVVTEIEYPTHEYNCLLQCLRFLTTEKKELILDYYLYKGHDKIEHHRRMAGELGISENALRGRAHHLRTGLEKCVLKCVQAIEENENRVSAHNI